MRKKTNLRWTIFCIMSKKQTTPFWEKTEILSTTSFWELHCIVPFTEKENKSGGVFLNKENNMYSAQQFNRTKKYL